MMTARRSPPQTMNGLYVADISDRMVFVCEHIHVVRGACTLWTYLVPSAPPS